MKISDFARENGVTVRLLRYYDVIGLLKPAHTDPDTGYRDYSPGEAERLSAIRFYQLLGFSLEETQSLLHQPEDARQATLHRQREALVRQCDRLNRLIALLDAPPPAPENPSLTALLSAYARAYHAQMGLVGFRDEFARALLTDEEWGSLRGYLLSGRDFLLPGETALAEEDALHRMVCTQFLPVTLARSAYCDEALRCAIRTGTAQAVLLGVGLETTALRHPGITVCEVDRPASQADKQSRLRRAGLRSPAVYVPADLTLDDIPARLREAGFDPTRKTFFTLLGVSYYLPLSALDALLGDISSIAVPGTAFLLDYAGDAFRTADVPRVRRMIAMADAAGEPILTTFTEGSLAALLERHGFALYEHVSWEALGARFLAAAPDVSAFEHINCALAVFTGK